MRAQTQLSNIYPNCQNLQLCVEQRECGLHFLYHVQVVCSKLVVSRKQSNPIVDISTEITVDCLAQVIYVVEEEVVTLSINEPMHAERSSTGKLVRSLCRRKRWVSAGGR